MERADSSSGSQHPQLPPGFRFHPTDEELVVHYLKKKVASLPLPVTIIADIDLYKFDPWELPSKATFGEHEWYFFSPRDRKYPNGARPNRAATSGYWKATGTDKPILTSNGAEKVGVKKALVFYGGKPPKGIKTNWIMHEYRLVDNNSVPKPPGIINMGSKKNSLRLDDWVLCRIYKKNSGIRPMDPGRERDDSSMEEMLASMQSSSSIACQHNNDHDNFFEGLLNGDTNNHNSMQSSSSKSDIMSVASNHLKRTIPQAQYWNEPGSVGSFSPGKRFHGGDQSTAVDSVPDGTGSFISLLNQLPNTALSSLGDSVLHHPFQLSGVNWN